MMYDLFRHKNKTAEPIFLMRAPLSTISEFLHLHREAEKRIVAEVEASGICDLWDIKRFPERTFHVVTKATGER
jgi:hypothetical protein